MTHTLRLFAQTAVLAAIYWACDLLVRLAGLPVPASVLGILVLFSLLCLGVMKENQVSEAASFLLKHLVFFFVPVTVGLMEWGDVFYDYGVVLLVAILLSSLLPLLGVSWVSLLARKGEKRCSK